MARMARRTQGTECRQCSAFCDRVIRPASCIERGCPYLYAYDDPLLDRRFMGCVAKVFAVEIDVELFEEAERTRAGFGAVKVARSPLPQCQFAVEQAFASAAGECSNRRFFDAPDDSSAAIRAFDLRDRC
jgi:hypothetical protein